MDIGKLLKQKHKSFDPSDTFRLIEVAYVSGRSFVTHLNKCELVIRLPGLLDFDTNDFTKMPLNIATSKGMIYAGLRTCLSIRMQQRVFQITHADRINQAKQRCLTQSLGIENGCSSDCLNCSNAPVLKHFIELTEQANKMSRPEPYAQICAGVLEKVLMGFRSDPWLLLGSQGFPNSMFRTLIEILKVGLRSHLTEKANFGFGALNRIEQVYRVVTQGKGTRRHSMLTD